MRLELASAALLLCSCTEPSVPSAQPHSTDSNASNAAGASGGASAGAGGTGAPQPTAKERQGGKSREQDPELDADAEDEPGGAQGTVTSDAGPIGATADASAASDAQPDAATSPPAIGNSADDDVVGTWYGPNEDTLGRDSTACVMLKQVGMVGPAGDTRYHGAFECTGTLAFVETADGVYNFRETATSTGACPSGRLQLTPLSDGRLKFNFFWNDGEIPDGVGILNRVDVCP